MSVDNSVAIVLAAAAAAERCPSNLAVVGAGVPQDFGGAGDQGGADSLSVPGRCHTDASDGPGGGAKDGREYGIGTGAAQQQGPGRGCHGCAASRAR